MSAHRLGHMMRSGLGQVARKALSQDDKRLLELGRYTDEWVLPRTLSEDDSQKFIPSRWFAEGLELNIIAQIALLERWADEYAPLFDVLRTDPAINLQFMGRPYLHNSYYPTPDAEIYGSMILDAKPSQIIEIGSGFSTLIARRCIQFANLDTAILSIDPHPRTEVRNAASQLMLSRVEDLDFPEVGITERTLLFIDSSHICRGAGDIPHLFCKVIPRLPAGVLVHVHDIFLPYDYPIVYLKRMYTEQYLLYATLANSDRYEILLTAHYMSRNYPREMQAAFGSIVGTHNLFFGASFWFRVL